MSPVPETWEPLERTFSVSSSDGKVLPAPSDREFWGNALYSVTVRRSEFVTLIGYHRRDRNPVLRDWRHEQQMKNELCGEQRWGMMLYPPEDKLVDTANEFWIVVLTDPDVNIPFGFQERAVMHPETASRFGATQRPFEPALRREETPVPESLLGRTAEDLIYDP